MRPTLYSPIARISRPRVHLHPRKLFLTHNFATHHGFSPVVEAQAPPQEAYWQQAPQWRTVSADQFINYQWQMNNSIQTGAQLLAFMHNSLSDDISPITSSSSPIKPINKSSLMSDIEEGIRLAPMSIRLSPHILSLINWHQPLTDPLFSQFIPLASRLRPDHPQLRFDSLSEQTDSPVPGLVHRYPDKALFLSTSVCPVYCRFCTRSYSVGQETGTVPRKKRFLPIAKRWEPMLTYVARTPQIRDVLVSGGDGYSLEPEQLLALGRRLLGVPHVQRLRFASKGLAVCPSRIVDPEDGWAGALERLSAEARAEGKAVSLQTHFNHPREISWVTEAAALRLYRAGVTVRNQTVLLNGVNSEFETMNRLIRRLAAINVQPYYVLQGDMVRGVEDLRTPLQTILDLEARIRGTISGYMTPNFIVTLPGGGGKRLACSFETYDRFTGLSRFRAPNSRRDGTSDEGQGEESKVWEYWDPLWSLSEEGQKEVWKRADLAGS